MTYKRIAEQLVELLEFLDEDDCVILDGNIVSQLYALRDKALFAMMQEARRDRDNS